jgi:lysozyme family protein
MQAEYQQLFDTCNITPGKYPLIDSVVKKITSNKKQYEGVSKATGVPWYLIGIIHIMECGGKFTTHLHNGDPLTAKTKRVPKNRPLTGTPPFKWEDSAKDALLLRKLDKITNWSIPEMLFQLEGYNGFGYRRRGIYSPYLWSYSNHYSKGKYTADGIYDPNAVSKQIGAAVLLRRMGELQHSLAGETDKITQIKRLGKEVLFNPRKYNAKAVELQFLLSSVGHTLKADGLAGRLTSGALHRVTGHYLQGDSRV